jgi:hypothetical protein
VDAREKRKLRSYAMVTLLLLVLTVVSASPVAEGPPGAAWAQAPEGMVLHAGPGVHQAGVLTLAQPTVVRTGETSGEFVEVFLADGFPVYLHGQFVEVDEANRRARLLADRVNLRLLPATMGLPPLGQLSQGEELQLLDTERGWVRVLAPAHVSLWARAAELEPVAASVAAARWEQGVLSREVARQRAVAAFRATDPGWVAASRREEEAERLAAVDLGTLDAQGLSAHAVAVEDLLGQQLRAPTRERLQQVSSAIVLEQGRRQAAAATAAEQAREDARAAANLVKEARALDMGLRFEGRGEALTLEGIVTRRASSEHEAVVYSIRDATGRTYKLSAAKEIAELPPLLGKKVVLEGRRIDLVNVDGPVLVVDKVARVSDADS